jgi:hypothetical protein
VAKASIAHAHPPLRVITALHGTGRDGYMPHHNLTATTLRLQWCNASVLPALHRGAERVASTGCTLRSSSALMLNLPGRCTGCRHQWYFNSSSLGRGVRAVHGRTPKSLVCCAAAPQKAAPRHQKKVWRCGHSSTWLDVHPIPSRATQLWHNMCTCVLTRDYMYTWISHQACRCRHCHSSIASLTAAYPQEMIPAR